MRWLLLQFAPHPLVLLLVDFPARIARLENLKRRLAALARCRRQPLDERHDPGNNEYPPHMPHTIGLWRPMRSDSRPVKNCEPPHSKPYTPHYPADVDEAQAALVEIYTEYITQMRASTNFSTSPAWPSAAKPLFCALWRGIRSQATSTLVAAGPACHQNRPKMGGTGRQKLRFELPLAAIF
mgnify:CR=1 FL=1